MRQRTTVAALAALLALTGLAVPGSPVAATAASTVVHTLTPAPGDLVNAGPIDVVAHLDAPAGIDHVELLVDGEPVTPLVEHDGTAGRATAPVAVPEGGHEVVVRLHDGDGAVTERRWGFTATDVPTTRLAGADRIGTALAISGASHPDDHQAPAVALARSDDFADALAGAPLAAHAGGPILLTRSDRLAPAVADELRRLLPDDGVVHLLGGVAALADDVAEDVRALGFDVIRHAGKDRFETAVAIAEALHPVDEVFVVSGQTFPDALAASAPAVRDLTPILLTRHDALPDVVGDWLAATTPARATIVGGTSAVGPEAAAAIAEGADLVTRVAGPDRWATAVAVADHFFTSGTPVTIASGNDFPDALAGARHAGGLGAPLLLVGALPSPTTAEHLRTVDPDAIVAFGGSASVSPTALDAIWRAATEDPGAPSVAGQSPTPASVVRTIDTIAVTFDRPLAADAQTYLEVGGREVVATTQVQGQVVAISEVALPADLVLEEDHEVRAVLRAAASDGSATHHVTSFTLHHHDPVFATVSGIRLFEPSTAIEVMGYHQSSHEGAQQLEPGSNDTPWLVMDSRGRGTGLRTAIDIVAAPDVAITAPATGRVVRAGSYVLYCEYTDHYLVIEPDEHPGWEVKLLHFRDLAVATGDRVIGGETVVGSGPRQLPFESQVDEHSGPDDHPHVHVEVVDPSIPNTGGGSC